MHPVLNEKFSLHSPYCCILRWSIRSLYTIYLQNHCNMRKTGEEPGLLFLEGVLLLMEGLSYQGAKDQVPGSSIPDFKLRNTLESHKYHRAIRPSLTYSYNTQVTGKGDCSSLHIYWSERYSGKSSSMRCWKQKSWIGDTLPHAVIVSITLNLSSKMDYQIFIVRITQEQI